MELRQLKYFIAVAEELHFGRAAARVHIAQPPFSQQIKSLEEEVGARLLNRTSRKVELTPEGKYFYNKAIDVLDKIKNASETVSLMAEGKAGTLRVGFTEIAIDSLLPEAIRSFRESSPDVIFKISQFGAAEQLRKIKHGKLDVGFATVIKYAMDGLQSAKLFSKKHYIAVPENHPFSAKSKVSLEEISKEHLILFPRSRQPDLYDDMMNAFSSKGLSVNIAQEVSGLSGAAALITAGMGVSFLPEKIILPRGGIVSVEVEDEFPTMDIYMCWNQEAVSNTALNFMEQVRKFFEVA